jgi:hypothetical protein
MDEHAILVLGLSLSSIATIVYVICHAFRQKSLPQLHCVILIFLSCAGIMAGLKICWMAVDRSVLRDFDGDRLYVFLGGFSVCWASFVSLWQLYKDIYSTKLTKRESE